MTDTEIPQVIRDLREDQVWRDALAQLATKPELLASLLLDYDRPIPNGIRAELALSIAPATGAAFRTIGIIEGGSQAEKNRALDDERMALEVRRFMRKGLSQNQAIAGLTAKPNRPNFRNISATLARVKKRFWLW